MNTLDYEIQELHGKIEALRVAWKRQEDVKKREILELQARPLKIALEMKLQKRGLTSK